MSYKDAVSIGILVSVIHRLGSIFVNSSLAPYRIGAGQHAYLLALNDTEGLTQEDLAKLFQLDKATVARAVAKLESEGYVKRETDNHDRRAYRLFLTQAARALIPEIQKTLKEWENALLKGMERAEREAFSAFLLRAARNAGEKVKSS